ncbi:MAG: hypothetical protein R2743_02380 [Ilumatobacteraceae bacterium]
MEQDQADLVSLQRSAAMLQPGTSIGVERDLLLRVLDELFSQRALLQRLGTDLKTVARKAH